MSIGQSRSSHAALARPVDPGARAALWTQSWLRALERVLDTLLTWQERSRQRHHLESLNDYMLRDIGLTRADVMAETTKRFWQR